jgi:DNA-directed RNA polymerase subunit E'/Rpb7
MVGSAAFAMFSSSTLADSVRLDAADLNDKYRDKLLHSLRSKYEGRCSRFGYIKSDSIVVTKVSPGAIRQSSLNGDVLFLVQFRASVFNPSVGARVEAIVCNENRFGVLACVYTGSPSESSIMMNVVIAKNSTIQSNQAALSKVNPGTRVTVEVLGKRYVTNDASISAIGRIVSAGDGGEFAGGGADGEDADDGVFKLAEEGNEHVNDDSDDSDDAVGDGDEDADADLPTASIIGDEDADDVEEEGREEGAVAPSEENEDNDDNDGRIDDEEPDEEGDMVDDIDEDIEEEDGFGDEESD